MTSIADLNLLLTQLRGATEGSAELNAAIWRIANWRAFSVCYNNAASGLPRDPPERLMGLGRIAVEQNAPNYTRSLDAALSLVPEGAVWHVMTDYGDLNRAKVGPPDNPAASIYKCEDRPLFVVANAATPCLALVIAALTARQEKPDVYYSPTHWCPDDDNSPIRR